MDVIIGLGFFAGLAGIFWVLPTVQARKLMGNKGYSPDVGMTLGIFLGMLGLLIAALLPPKVQKDKPGDTKKCPECAETIRAEAIKCRYCGAGLVVG